MPTFVCTTAGLLQELKVLQKKFINDVLMFDGAESFRKSMVLAFQVRCMYLMQFCLGIVCFVPDFAPSIQPNMHKNMFNAYVGCAQVLPLKLAIDPEGSQMDQLVNQRIVLALKLRFKKMRTAFNKKHGTQPRCVGGRPQHAISWTLIQLLMNGDLTVEKALKLGNEGVEDDGAPAPQAAAPQTNVGDGTGLQVMHVSNMTRC